MTTWNLRSGPPDCGVGQGEDKRRGAVPWAGGARAEGDSASPAAAAAAALGRGERRWAAGHRRAASTPAARPRSPLLPPPRTGTNSAAAAAAGARMPVVQPTSGPSLAGAVPCGCARCLSQHSRWCSPQSLASSQYTQTARRGSGGGPREVVGRSGVWHAGPARQASWPVGRSSAEARGITTTTTTSSGHAQAAAQAQQHAAASGHTRPHRCSPGCPCRGRACRRGTRRSTPPPS